MPGCIDPTGISKYLREDARRIIVGSDESKTSPVLGAALTALADKVRLKDLSHQELVRLCMHACKNQTRVDIDLTWIWTVTGDIAELTRSTVLEDVEHILFTRRNPQDHQERKTYVLFRLVDGGWLVEEFKNLPEFRVRITKKNMHIIPAQMDAFKKNVEEFIRVCGIADDCDED